MEDIKKKVQSWWDGSPCCSRIASAPRGTKEFYEQVDIYKDTYEPFTNIVADYASWKGKRVLEIGCGIGKDFSRFVAGGAIATAIDMSIESLKLTKERLKVFGLNGKLCMADAENLPFKNNVFDLVFSWGVLHHTPNTQKAISEAHRCAKPGGKAIIMLYKKYSLFSLHCLLLYCRRRKDYASRDEPLAAFTDGEGNPLSKVYSKRDILKMFSAFDDIRISAYEPRGSRFIKIFKLFPMLENRFGWFMVIEAKKHA